MSTRVLVVEDDEEAAAFLQDLLPEFGYEPLLARSAEAARMTLETERPDVILLDVRLPLMSGLDFLQLDPVRRSRVPIVILSGAATEDEARECLRRGALDFVGKPVNVELLRQVLLYAELQAPQTRLAQSRRAADRRRSGRPGLKTPVRGLEYNGTEWVGTCVDLSTFGMKIRLPTSIIPGPAVRLSFSPPDGGPGLSLLSIRVRRAETGDYAFRFVNLTHTEFKRLRDCVEGPCGQP